MSEVASRSHGTLPFLLGLLLSVVTAGALAPPVVQAAHFPWDQNHDTTDWQDPEDPGPCEGPQCDPCRSTGSPVYLPTGHLIWSDTDVAMAGRPGVSLTRTYNSHDARAGAFGNGWTTGCEMGLYRVASTATTDSGSRDTVHYVLRYPNGKRYEFMPSGSGTFRAATGRFETVEARADGSAVLRGQGGGERVFNANGTLRSETAAAGSTLSYGYDGGGRITRMTGAAGQYLTFSYGADGRVTAVADHTGRRWRYAYDDNGNLLNVTDPAGGVRRYEYEAYQPPGDSVTYHHLTRIVDATDVVVTEVVYDGTRVASYTVGQDRIAFRYDLSAGTVRETDSRSARVTFTLNEAGLVTRIEDPLRASRAFTYDANGDLTGYTDETGAEWANTYDALGRRVSSSNPLGDTKRWEYAGTSPRPVAVVSATGRRTEYSYDADGPLTRVRLPNGSTTTLAYDAAGNFSSSIDAIGGQSSVGTSGQGLVERAVTPSGKAAAITYTARGEVETVTNTAGDTLRFSYDVLGRQTAVTDPEGGVTRTAFDAAGRAISVTDAAGAVTTFAYDTFGRLATRTYPDGRTHTYTYRSDNLIDRATAPDGVVTRFFYDGAKRVTAATSGGESRRYTYDAAHRMLTARNRGGTVTFAYDAAGRRVSEQLGTQLLTYELNAEGERTRLDALGSQIGYERNAVGQITALNAPEGRYGFTYDALQRRTGLSYPGGSTVEYDFDANNRLTSQTYRGGFEADYGYEYDDRGLLSRWSGDGAPWEYEHNGDGELLGASQGADRYAYAMDSAGNITGGSRVYDTSNRLLEDADYRYAYDLRGNLVLRTDKANGARTTYQWNEVNELERIERFVDATTRRAESRVDFTYGPFGRRWSRTEDGQQERYVYDGADRIAVVDTAGAVLQRVTYGTRVDEPLGLTDASGQRYYHANALGSVMALSDADGVTDSYRYDPYGALLSANESGGNPFGYTGREFEGDGLYYYRARYYAPGLQRFISEDPLAFVGGDANLYRYIGNSPATFADPSGNILPALVVIWAGVEIGLAIYDAYDAASTIFDPCSSGWEKALAGGLFALGAVAPGGGYGAADDIGETVYRGMRDAGGSPLTGPTARTLGARPGTDIPVDVNGMVYPGTGGMSVAPSPGALPPHRRPPELGGTGKDPVWGLDTNDLGPDLQYVPDSPTHGTIQPSRPMTSEEYQNALCSTGQCWFRP